MGAEDTNRVAPSLCGSGHNTLAIRCDLPVTGWKPRLPSVSSARLAWMTQEAPIGHPRLVQA